MFKIIVTIAEVSLVTTAFLITTQSEIIQVIKVYSLQSYLLTIASILIATVGRGKNLVGVAPADIFKYKTFIAIGIIALLPIILGTTIHWILARATVYEPGQDGKIMTAKAKVVWLESSYKIPEITVLYFFGLLLLSFAISFFGIKNNPDESLGIAVSLLLILTGLYNALSRQDVISQMVGILTMDQGMLLGIVKIVSIPVPATLFVIAVYFYTGITLLLLFLIVPSLRRVRESINLDKIASKSELKG